MERISIIIPLGERSEYIAKESVEKQREGIELITEIGENPSKNRNVGAKKAKGDFLAFINGHTTLADDWAERVIEFFRQNPKADIVGGPQLTSDNERGIAKASGYALASKFGTYKVSNRYAGEKNVENADETMLTSANLICRKKVFKKVKFDEGIYPGEDPKFVSDAKKAGLNVSYSPSIKVYNKRRGSVGELAKQVFNYGKTRPEKESFCQTLKMPFFLMPSLFLIYLTLAGFLLAGTRIFGNPVFQRSPWAAWEIILLAPLLIYLVVNMSVSALTALSKKDISLLLWLPAIFLTIHLSYGAGFLFSSIKKIAKNEK